MSRTFRKCRRSHFGNKKYTPFIRKPKTLNEIRHNDALISDMNSGEFEYKISGQNRIVRRKNLPTLWDDIHIAGNKEDYQNKHFYD